MANYIQSKKKEANIEMVIIHMSFTIVCAAKSGNMGDADDLGQGSVSQTTFTFTLRVMSQIVRTWGTSKKKYCNIHYKYKTLSKSMMPRMKMKERIVPEH